MAYAQRFAVIAFSITSADNPSELTLRLSADGLGGPGSVWRDPRWKPG
jgi:hypothetical protein